MGFLDSEGLAHYTEWVKSIAGNGGGAPSSDRFFLIALPGNVNPQAVAYGNGRFVTTPGNNRNEAAYTDDGVTWVPTTFPTDAYWADIAYGNGRFAAVAGNDSNHTSNIAVYSEDGGETWTRTTLPYTAVWRSITFGNGRFVAISSGSYAAYSDDGGKTWIGTSFPSGSNWQSVCHGNGRFVAVASGGNGTAYSEDGVTWTKTSASGGYWVSVAFGNGRFVTVSNSKLEAGYSEDGVEWTVVPLPIGGNYASVAYGNGVFVAIGGNITTTSYTSNTSVKPYNSLAAYSEDGAAWAAMDLPTVAPWTFIAYGNGKFVAVSSSGQLAACGTFGSSGNGNSGGGSGSCENVYSTEEQRIGTWVDGKPLYRRILIGEKNDDTLSAVSFKFEGFVEIDAITRMSGTLDEGSNVLALPFNNSQSYVLTSFYSPGGYVSVGGTWRAKNAKAIVTIEYTKTTDEAVSG